MEGERLLFMLRQLHIFVFKMLHSKCPKKCNICNILSVETPTRVPQTCSSKYLPKRPTVPQISGYLTRVARNKQIKAPKLYVLKYRLKFCDIIYE